ncbi:MAG: hypothetical protein JWM47_2936 [Acidimicrobiales bacterium]|nr:hypothetical protein [Acidimicrobiales bacterium]
MTLHPSDETPVRRVDRGRSAIPAPGGPHDPDAPDRLEPVPGSAPQPGASPPAPTPDQVGPGPGGDDPMQGDAPSG